MTRMYLDLVDNQNIKIPPRTNLTGDGVAVENNDVSSGTEVGDISISLVLMSSYIIFFMQCGFCMLSAGSVRLKNAKNIILKNLLDACIGALGWYFLGFALAFGSKGDSFLGTNDFALVGVNLSEFHKFLQQFGFAATSATIVSGAVAERTKFEAYLLYAFFLTGWVYPIVAHWVWSDFGWLSPYALLKDRYALNNIGLIDFSGCAVVHLVGGASGLAGAFIVGPRLGKFDSQGKPRKIPGHSAALVLLGIFILWFGWYGFNPGSALLFAHSNDVAALSAVNTTLSAASGCLAVLFTSLFFHFYHFGVMVWDVIGAGNGVLAGLVSITACCSVVAPWVAFVVGIIGGLVYLLVSHIILHKLKIDDPLDAIAIHAGCGTWGLLAASAFADKDYMYLTYKLEIIKEGYYGFMFTGSNFILLANAIIGIIVISAWVLAHMIPFFFLLKYFGLLRVPPIEEHEGLDVSHHGGSAYPKDLIRKTHGLENSSMAARDLLSEVEMIKSQLAMFTKKYNIINEEKFSAHK